MAAFLKLKQEFFQKGGSNIFCRTDRSEGGLAALVKRKSGRGQLGPGEGGEKL
jgi:hypothetical protein